MPGAKCPKCNKLTVYKNSDGSACSQSDCGFSMVMPKAKGKGGRGKKCMNCKKLTVHNNTCSSCGATNNYQAIKSLDMNVNTILKANNIQELKSLGSYLEVKSSFENELGSKLGAKGWKSFFEKVNVLKEVVSSNKDYLASICDKNSFRESKNELSKLLELKVKAKGWNELKRKIQNFIVIFCANIFDPSDYYETMKQKKFKNSSKLEGIDVEIPDEKISLESVLAKYKR